MDKIYFIGIGGIGMSALARFFKHQGWSVAGYDRVSTPLTEKLEAEGIAVHYTDSVDLIAAQFTDPATTQVVYTPAIPADHSELQWFRTKGFDIKKRSEVLGLLARDKYVMAVAGTHGKTTTSTMTAHLNTVGAGEGSAFLGGVSKNFGSNMVLGSGDRLAVEADEFDRSFLQLFPNVAVITSTDADHLDIYGDHSHMIESFEAFAAQVKDTLIIKKGLQLRTPKGGKVMTYSLDDNSSDFYARNIKLLPGGYYSFEIVTPEAVIGNLRLGIPGLINVENCVAAVALVSCKGYREDRLREAIATFKGVARRFEFYINTDRLVYMDDYAHHPAELTAMLRSVRSMMPGRKITIAFQPHLYSRTRDFAEGFAQALSLADHVILLPIYPARELPLPGITSKIIYDRITCSKEMLDSRTMLPNRVSNMECDVFITAGAGDIDSLCGDLDKILEQRLLN